VIQIKKLEQWFEFFDLVGLLGIEPSLSAPKADVLPVYYSPLEFLKEFSEALVILALK
jgi:hypothetical protein